MITFAYLILIAIVISVIFACYRIVKLEELIMALIGGSDEMAVIYVHLILKGIKTFDDVLFYKKAEVAELLKASEAADLITDEKYK